MTAVLGVAERRRADLLSDEEIVERVRAGDTSLFEILMRRHNQRIYRAVRAVLGSDVEAEDVMQEAYVRAYQHLDQFEGRARFITWLTRIALHESFARRRQSQRLYPIESSSEEEPDIMSRLASGERTPEHQAHDRELKVLLEGAVDALPERYRLVFVLREVEELDTAEAAGCLGITEETVKTRLHRARALLRKGLFARAGATSSEAFQFHASRCDRVVAAVMARIGLGV